MQLGKDSYDIVIERGVLAKAGELLDLDRRVLVVTDDGVPSLYAQKILEQSKDGVLVTLPAGEATKDFSLQCQAVRTKTEFSAISSTRSPPRQESFLRRLSSRLTRDSLLSLKLRKPKIHLPKLRHKKVCLIDLPKGRSFFMPCFMFVICRGYGRLSG